MLCRVGVVSFAILLACLLAPAARAQESTGITVSGSAKVSGKPTSVGGIL